MRINIILPGLGDSGGIRVLKKYSELLRAKGIDVIIYSPIVASNLHRYKTPIVNKVHQAYCTLKTLLKIRSKKYAKWIPSVKDKYIRDADCTIASLWSTAFLVNKLDQKKGEKWYFIQDFEIWDNEKYGMQSYRLPLNKIVISTWINERLKERLGIGPFPVIYNGLDSQIFNCNGRTEHKGFNFLMLNHTLKKKGVEEGLEVFYRIKKIYPNTKLRMFGMCSNKNIGPDIEYYQNPSRDKLLSLYKDTDIFIFPSIEEGWGLTPLEAMASGAIVVGTRTGFVLDLGINQYNMMISEPGDIQSMVDNISILINNSELRTMIRENAQNTISQLSWNNSRNKLLELLEHKNEDS